ncbi:MAG: glycoside hydrolase family 43 protein [Actinomycetota bacterium]|nr:glycoside hydrolase family 43 protein [Actinomycetota bacterium]
MRSSYLALVLGVFGALVVAGLAPAHASVGSDDFVAGQTYRGDFADPWITKSGHTYYAYATNTANLNLPVMTSKDLVTWTARQSNDGPWWHNDAMPRAARWAATEHPGGRTVTRTWAPSVTWVKNHYVLAYTVPLAGRKVRKNCVSLATSTSPQGPFTDNSSGPIVCPADQGAIDPQVFLAKNTHPYLIWKTEGVVGRESTKLWSRQLNDSGTAFVPGTPQTELLRTSQAWEGHVIENPAMIRIQGLNYLFYSANEYNSPRYAIGYAICRTVRGPCTRPRTTPLMSSGGAVSGPGGPAPVVGPNGQLRLAYAAWDYGRIGYPRSTRCRPHCNQRRLHIAQLQIDIDGLLHVTDRG